MECWRRSRGVARARPNGSLPSYDWHFLATHFFLQVAIGRSRVIATSIVAFFSRRWWQSPANSTVLLPPSCSRAVVKYYVT